MSIKDCFKKEESTCAHGDQMTTSSSSGAVNVFYLRQGLSWSSPSVLGCLYLPNAGIICMFFDNQFSPAYLRWNWNSILLNFLQKCHLVSSLGHSPHYWCRQANSGSRSIIGSGCFSIPPTTGDHVLVFVFFKFHYFRHLMQCSIFVCDQPVSHRKLERGIVAHFVILALWGWGREISISSRLAWTIDWVPKTSLDFCDAFSKAKKQTTKDSSRAGDGSVVIKDLRPLVTCTHSHTHTYKHLISSRL